MIGIFDSGSGGLTVLKAIRDSMRNFDIVYFGDLKNAPYGERSRSELSHLTVEGIKTLKARGATSIISACNSVSASLAVSLFDTLDLSPEHLIEMVGPTVRYLRHFDKPLLVAATPATIESGIYQDAFAMVGVDITPVPIPGLAGAIEFGSDDERIEQLTRDALSGLDGSGHGGLVLACTHYPLALGSFEKSLRGMPIFDPATAVAERVEEKFWPAEAGDGKLRFLISAESDHFRRRVTEMFPGAEFSIEVLA